METTIAERHRRASVALAHRSSLRWIVVGIAVAHFVSIRYEEVVRWAFRAGGL